MAKAWILTKRPGAAYTEDVFALQDVAEPVLDAESGKNLILEPVVISVDPYLRMRLNAVNYFNPVEIGTAMSSTGVSRVVEASADAAFSVGDLVAGPLTWATRFAAAEQGLNKIDTSLAPAADWAGLLSIVGLSAYFPMKHIAQPKEGETVFVSAAAGAVGSLVGQIAKLRGCRVIGAAGSAEKLAFLRELGFDATINYKTEDVGAALRAHAPDGVDIYWDNVGGETLDTVLPQMRSRGRIVACGSISQYNLPAEERYGLKNLFVVTTKQVRLEGFLVPQYQAEFPEGVRQLVEWKAAGKLTLRETKKQGFESLPGALAGLFKGENIGKMLVEV